MTEIAVVGAGVAGLGAASALRDTDAAVTVFERRKSLGGRAATRRRDGCVYDVGANYAKDTDPHVADLAVGELAEGLVETAGQIWTFDEDGTIAEGCDDDGRKWTYREGLAAMADRLREASDAEVRTSAEVVRLAREGAGRGSAREDDRWELQVRGGTATADAVILTPPAPVTADLLDRSEWDDQLCTDLRDAAAEVPYRTLLTVALHYPYRADRPYYALVNDDKSHALGWVAREECKPGHVPEGESLLVVQPAPEWSREHYDDPDDQIAVAAADRTAELLGDPDRYRFDWADVARWRDALPDAGADREILARGADRNLFFAGDWAVGEGRLHAALRSGLETGERVRETV